MAIKAYFDGSKRPMNHWWTGAGDVRRSLCGYTMDLDRLDENGVNLPLCKRCDKLAPAGFPSGERQRS